jgi:hypothetical protein
LKESDNQHTDAKKGLRWLFKKVAPASGWIGLGLCSGLLLIVQAGFLARIIHGAVIDGKNRETLWPFFLTLAGIYLVRSLLGWGREVSGFEASAKIRRQVRSTLMAHITRLGPAYVSGRHTGTLASTVMKQVEGLHGFFAHYLPQMALAIMIPAAILTYVFPVSWAAGTLLMVTAPLILLFMVMDGHRQAGVQATVFSEILLFFVGDTPFGCRLHRANIFVQYAPCRLVVRRDPRRAPSRHLISIQIHVDGIAHRVDGNRIPGANQRNGTAFLGFRGDMAHNESVGAAGEATVCNQGH